MNYCVKLVVNIFFLFVFGTGVLTAQNTNVESVVCSRPIRERFIHDILGGHLPDSCIVFLCAEKRVCKHCYKLTALHVYKQVLSVAGTWPVYVVINDDSTHIVFSRYMQGSNVKYIYFDTDYARYDINESVPEIWMVEHNSIKQCVYVDRKNARYLTVIP